MQPLDMNTLMVDADFDEPNREEAADAYREAYYHFILMDFEALLFKHGLKRLLKDISDEGAKSLVAQADEIITSMENC